MGMFPMIQVAGPQGTVMVFRPWNEKDLKEAMTDLPHPKDSGEKFANDLDMFCKEFSPTMQELKRLLMLKLGATDWRHSTDVGISSAKQLHEWIET